MPTQLEHAIKNRPRYFKRIKDMLEAHELKAKPKAKAAKAQVDESSDVNIVC